MLQRFEELLEEDADGWRKHRERLGNPSSSDMEEEYFWDRQFVSGFSVSRIKEHEMHAILETAGWYSDDIINMIVPDDCDMEKPPKDVIRKLAHFSVLLLMAHEMNMYDSSLKDNSKTMSADEIEQLIISEILCQGMCRGYGGRTSGRST